MKTFLRTLLALAVLGLIALAAFIFIPVQRSKPAQPLPADWQASRGAGRWLRT